MAALGVMTMFVTLFRAGRALRRWRIANKVRQFDPKLAWGHLLFNFDHLSRGERTTQPPLVFLTTPIPDPRLSFGDIQGAVGGSIPLDDLDEDGRRIGT